MKIKKQIIKARSILFWQDLFIYLLWTGIIIPLLIMILIELESIFYFLPDTKLNLIRIMSVSIFFALLFITIQYIRSKNDKIKKYKIETIAFNIGDKAFPKKQDTILNALQLERSSRNNESEELAQAYINNTFQKIQELNIRELLKNEQGLTLKKFLLVAWLSIVCIFYLQYNSSANAFFRLTHPSQEFPAPKPFSLNSLTGNIHILGGEKTEIQVQSLKSMPDTVFLYLKPSQVSTQKRDSLVLKYYATPNKNGSYQFKLPELFQDYYYQAVVKAQYFWEAWEEVRSKPDTIFVTDRPVFESFSMTIIPPKYSGEAPRLQEGNIAVVQSLKGSIVKIDIASNRMLNSAYLLINQNKLNMEANYNRAVGEFSLDEEGEFTVNIVDQRGITNRDPIPYSIEIIADFDPIITVISPPPLTELGNDPLIPIHLEIQDDFGFTDLQLAYEVRRPNYLDADPFVAMFNIPELIQDTLIQSIYTFWDLSDMLLMPEDEVHFHFELTDNDNISGPKKTISSTFIARVPSLADLYETAENSESDFINDLSEGLNEILDLKEELEELELKTLKAKELDWDQQQTVNNTLEQAKQELDNLENLAEAIEAIKEQAEKHKLFSPELLEKFQELSELLGDIIPEDMLKNMDELQNALDNMDMESLNESLKELSENMSQIEQDLDRYLEVFKRLQAEQKMDELQNRMQQLLKQQASLNQEMAQLDETADQSTLQRLAQEEQRNLDELENIESLLEQASELVEPFSESTSQELMQLMESDIIESAENSMNDVTQSLSDQELQSAQSASQESLQNLEMMMQQIMEMKQEFQQETVSDMTENFQGLMQDMLYLSAQEEQLQMEVKKASRNSPRLRELASRQQLLQDQLQSITTQMLELSKKTFAITPDIGRGVGKANAGMQEAKANLAERNITQTGKNQNMAMEGLNEAALGLFNSMQAMQKSGSASGYEQFLEMMKKMSGQQQGLNQQGMQMGLGQMAAAAQQQMMQEMLQKQQGIRKSLGQMLSEMKQSGQPQMGNLDGISSEMDEVIKDLQRKRFNRKTQERQQRILSRMLDSQTSMTQRGQKEERKSSGVEPSTIFEGPGGLPFDLGQRENLALEALNNAINAGYSKEHQSMIKRYFNAFSQTQKEIETKDIPTDNE